MKLPNKKLYHNFVQPASTQNIIQAYEPETSKWFQTFCEGFVSRWGARWCGIPQDNLATSIEFKI